jgi:molybdate transport system substrate-binding protein
MKRFLNFTVLLIITVFGICGVNAFAAERLMIFAGAASRPPTEEIVKAFENRYGVKVDINFGGSGFVLSQMLLSKQGDIYFPGSSDYMEVAKRKNAVFPDTEKIVVYLVPAINVQKGNPKGIKNLKDLLKPALKIVMANPEGVCLGTYAVEIIEKNFTLLEKTAFRKNLVNYAESCEKTATVISLKLADAVIGWSVFEHWDPERIETVPLRSSEITRIGYIPIAISRFTKNKELSRKFIDFIISREGKAIFRKYRYFMNEEEAFVWIGDKKSIGGEYIVPEEWIRR